MEFKRRAIVWAVAVSVFGLAIGASSARAAQMFLAPAALEVVRGTTLVSELRLDTEGADVNALDVTVHYPVAQLELVDVSTGGSIFTLFPEPPRSTSGSVRIQAGVPGGFEGSGVVARFTWRALTSGPVTFGEDAIAATLLANEPASTNVPVTVVTARYEVTEAKAGLPVLSSKDHADETVWYSVPFIRMSWEPSPGAAYSYVLSRLPDEVPDEVPDEPVGSIKLDTPEDGLFYFHLRECRAGQCGSVVTRRAQKDGTPPEPFTVEVTQDESVYGGNAFISFNAYDVTSGIDRYEVRESRGDDIGQWVIVQNPYVLHDQALRSVIEVKAVDRAGNERLTVVRPEPAIAAGIGWLIGGMIVMASAAIFWLGYHFHRQGKRRAGPPSNNGTDTPL